LKELNTTIRSRLGGEVDSVHYKVEQSEVTNMFPDGYREPEYMSNM